MLDSEFLVYAISEKIQQAHITGLTSGLIMESKALAEKVNKNENVPTMCRIEFA